MFRNPVKFLFSISILFVASVLWAQIDTRVATSGPSSGVSDANGNISKEGSQEHEAFLSGVQDLKGSLAHDRVSISAQISEVGDSYARQSPQSFPLGTFTQFGGQLQVQHSWRLASTVAEYAGGSSAGGNGSSLAQNYHEAGVTQTLLFRRWSFVGGGHVTYLPESGFGFNALRLLPDANASLSSAVLPDQTILTQTATQLNETFVSQAEYSFSRLSAVSMFGEYFRQTFDSHALLDNTQISATAAYNHILNVRSTVALSYSLGRFTFDASPIELLNHTVQLSYGHRIGTRADFRIAAGPQIRQFRNVASPETPITLAGGADLEYQRRRTHLDLGYSRQTSGGSGVLLGSLVDQVFFTMQQDMGRVWHAGTSISYAHNGSLGGVSLQPQQQFNAVYATFRIDRNLGRSVTAFASYGAQIQTSSTSAGIAQTQPTRHLITIGLSFHHTRMSSPVLASASDAYRPNAGSVPGTGD